MGAKKLKPKVQLKKSEAALRIVFDVDQLIDDVMASYPEASSCSLRCTDWRYSRCEFDFHDVEEDKHYKLNRPKLRRAMKKLLQDLFDGQLPGIGQYVLRDFKDAGNWDADASDALAQYAIFGKAIYG